MSFFLSIFTNTGTFDNLTQGYFDANSNCGWDENCAAIKDCIYRVCEPQKSMFDGTVYDSCVKKCNESPDMGDFDDFFCENPETVYRAFGYKCPNYKPDTSRSISLFGRDITFLQIATAIVFFIIIYIIIQNL